MQKWWHEQLFRWFFLGSFIFLFHSLLWIESLSFRSAWYPIALKYKNYSLEIGRFLYELQHCELVVCASTLMFFFFKNLFLFVRTGVFYAVQIVGVSVYKMWVVKWFFEIYIQCDSVLIKTQSLCVYFVIYGIHKLPSLIKMCRMNKRILSHRQSVSLYFEEHLSVCIRSCVVKMESDSVFMIHVSIDRLKSAQTDALTYMNNYWIVNRKIYVSRYVTVDFIGKYGVACADIKPRTPTL